MRISAHSTALLGQAWVEWLAVDRETREAMRLEVPRLSVNTRLAYEEFFRSFDAMPPVPASVPAQERPPILNPFRRDAWRTFGEET